MENQQKEKKLTKKIRCSKCASTFGYLRIKERKWVCRSCGHEEKIMEEDK